MRWFLICESPRFVSGHYPDFNQLLAVFFSSFSVDCLRPKSVSKIIFFLASTANPTFFPWRGASGVFLFQKASIPRGVCFFADCPNTYFLSILSALRRENAVSKLELYLVWRKNLFLFELNSVEQNLKKVSENWIWIAKSTLWKVK